MRNSPFFLNYIFESIEMFAFKVAEPPVCGPVNPDLLHQKSINRLKTNKQTKERKETHIQLLPRSKLPKLGLSMSHEHRAHFF